MINTSNYCSFLNKSNQRSKFLIVFMFFFIQVILGIALFDDYGISSDEKVERDNGVVSLNYVGDVFGLKWIKNNPQLNKERSNNQPLIQYKDRDYPVGFNLPAVFLERLFKIDDERSIYLFRHLINYLFCLIGVYAVYRLSERRFSDWRIGLLSALFFVVSPRLFAESFYNSKDSIFMGCIAIATYTLITFVQRPNYVTLILHALATAFAMNIRIMGIIIPFLTFGVFFIEVLRQRLLLRRALALFMFYLVACLMLMLMIWPWLWISPINHFVEAFRNMAHFRWDGEMLYFGSLIRSTQLPFHYSPAWVLITTPPVYIFLWLIGVFGALYQLFQFCKKFICSNEDQQDFIFLALCLGPVFAVIVLHSVLYDSWRQLYFIYPAFILLATRGLVICWHFILTKHPFFKIVFTLGIAISVGNTALWIAKSHPLQNVYFNIFAGKNWKSNFDVDYWGLSNRLALEYILDHDSKQTILVYPGSFTPLGLAFKLLKEDERNRIIQTAWIGDADYVVTNYRLNNLDYAEVGSSFTLFHHIMIDDEIIASIYKADRSNGKNVARFSNDIWLGINNEILRYVLDNDSRPYIRVRPGDDFTTPLVFQHGINLNSGGRSLDLKLKGEADYLIFDFRIHPKGNVDSIPGYQLNKIFEKSGEIVGALFKRNLNLSPMSPTLVGEKIIFSRGGNGLQYLVGLMGEETYLTNWGWTFPEAWGVWSDGNKSKIFLPIPIEGSSSLILDARALVSESHPLQKIEININGVHYKQLILTKSDQNRIEIPITQSYKNQGFLNIEFKFLNAVRPKAVGIGDDERMITLGLMSATFIY